MILGIFDDYTLGLALMLIGAAIATVFAGLGSAKGYAEHSWTRIDRLYDSSQGRLRRW